MYVLMKKKYKVSSSNTIENERFTYGQNETNESLRVVNVWGKRFKLPQLTHESFLTIDHSCKIFF